MVVNEADISLETYTSLLVLFSNYTKIESAWLIVDLLDVGVIGRCGGGNLLKTHDEAEHFMKIFAVVNLFSSHKEYSNI